jgi:hypothetical protein
MAAGTQERNRGSMYQLLSTELYDQRTVGFSFEYKQTNNSTKRLDRIKTLPMLGRELTKIPPRMTAAPVYCIQWKLLVMSSERKRHKTQTAVSKEQ